MILFSGSSVKNSMMYLLPRLLPTTNGVPAVQKFHTSRSQPTIQSLRFGDGEKHVIMSPACKTALITGGTSGSGFAAASELLAHGANRVVITGPDLEEGNEALDRLTNQYGNDKATFFQGDVSCIHQFKKIFKEVIRQHQKIDILFNNAEIADDEQWEKEIDTNFRGVLCGTLLAFKYMGKRSGANGGVVINNASIVGLDSLPYAPIYSATKHAVVSLTRNLGAPYHYGQTGLRVVALCPGITPSLCTSNMYGRQLMKQKNYPTSCPVESPPDVVGRAIVQLVSFADSGTIWSLEKSDLSQIHIPHSKEYLKLVKSFK